MSEYTVLRKCTVNLSERNSTGLEKISQPNAIDTIENSVRKVRDTLHIQLFQNSKSKHLSEDVKGDGEKY
jgi:hypothetical protein